MSDKEYFEYERTDYTDLNWENSKFSYSSMVSLYTIGDGSCFFHAIVQSFYIPYIQGYSENKPLNKKKYVKNLRQELASYLDQKVDDGNEESKTFYDILSCGQLSELAKDLPQCKKDFMKIELGSSQPVGNNYLEFMCIVLEKDIYLLDAEKKDVYFTGDEELVYKGRDSIVVIYFPGHYETVGVKTGDKIKTLFEPDDPFIQAIRKRIEFVKKISN